MSISLDEQIAWIESESEQRKQARTVWRAMVEARGKCNPEGK
jgi:hypothetical protein